MKPTHDTPRTDACPHCGAELDRRSTINAGYWCYECGSTYRGGDLCQSPLCRERKARQKAEAKVQKLDRLLTDSLKQNEKFREWAEATLRRAVEIAEGFREILQLDKDSRLGKELNAIKQALNPTNK